MAFRLAENEVVAIYGYTKRGIEIKEYLKEQGVYRIFFVDRRKVDNNEIIYTYSEFASAYRDNINVRIIISLQNAMEHQKIADDLFRDNFCNIIFLPASKSGNTEKKCYMRKIYNQFIDGTFSVENEIPSYDEIFGRFCIKVENGIIQQEENEIIFWMKMQNIFVNNAREKVVEENLKYYGRNLATVKHYQALFEWFEKGIKNENFDEYIRVQNFFDEKGDYRIDKIIDRYRLWILYKEELNKGMDFFISSAPKMVMNNRGGLNITDGLHRCIFLYMQGFAYMPVKLNKTEFDRCFRTKALSEIVTFINENKLSCSITPIEHPAFYGFPCEKETVEPTVLDAVQKFIGVLPLEDMNILDVSDYNSYFARYMSKMKLHSGNGRIVTVEMQKEKYEFANLLNDLLGISDVEVVKSIDWEWDEKMQFDFVFLMGHFDKYKSDLLTMKKIGSITRKLLFIETESEYRSARILTEMLHFSKCETVMEYVNGIRKRIVYALCK